MRTKEITISESAWMRYDISVRMWIAISRPEAEDDAVGQVAPGQRGLVRGNAELRAVRELFTTISRAAAGGSRPR
jgi:hypothetical protein